MANREGREWKSTGIFRDLTKATIFRYDYNTGKPTAMDLNKYFKNERFKIKLINHQGADICLENKDFISDINFTESNKVFIKNLVSGVHKSLRGATLSAVDYNEEENWTLTYGLRGYQVKFSDTPIEPIKSYLGRIIYFILRKKHRCYDSEESDYKYDGYDTDSNRIVDTEPINDSTQHIEFLTSYLKDRFTTSSIYIEKSHLKPRECINIVKTQYKGRDVLEMSSNMGKVFGYLIRLSEFTSPNLTDYQVHSDEGAYDSGINSYDRGLVLIGGQNMGVQYYGMAVYHEILIPDCFLESVGGQDKIEAW